MNFTLLHIQVDLADLSSPTRASTISTEATFVTAWEIICALPNSTVHSEEAVVSGFWVTILFHSPFSPQMEMRAPARNSHKGPTWEAISNLRIPCKWLLRMNFLN